MRGGAIPVFLWGLGLAVLLVINAIWTGDAIQGWMFAFAVVVVIGSAAWLSLGRAEAWRRGPPSRSSAPEAVPKTSLAALGLGVSIAAMMFAIVFGKFLVFIGAGVFLLSLGRLGLEVRAQRKSLRERK